MKKAEAASNETCVKTKKPERNYISKIKKPTIIVAIIAAVSLAFVLCSRYINSNQYTNSNDWISEIDILQTPDGKIIVEAFRKEFPNWANGGLNYVIHSDKHEDESNSRVIVLSAFRTIQSSLKSGYVEVLSSCQLRLRDGIVFDSLGVIQYEKKLLAPTPNR